MGKRSKQMENGQGPAGYPQGQPTAGHTPTSAPYAAMRYGMGAASQPTPSPIPGGGAGGVGVGAGAAGAAGAFPQVQQVWPAGAAMPGAPGMMGMSPQAMLQQEPEKKRRRWPWVLLLLLLLLIVAAVLCFFLLDCNGGSKRSGVAGQLEGKSEAEIQAELDRVVEEGMFNISIASSVQMASGTAPAELRIENVPGNRYLMRVVIIEEATGEQLYETDLIEPNYHIQEDTLDVALSPGNHSCLALFYAYDPETEEEVGQAAARITIQVAG